MSSRTLAGVAVIGSGRPPSTAAVAFAAATMDVIAIAREIVAVNGGKGFGGSGAGHVPTRVNVMRVNPTMRLTPVAVSEYTGTYWLVSVSASDWHVTAAAPGRADPTVAIAEGFATNRPTSVPGGSGHVAVGPPLRVI